MINLGGFFQGARRLPGLLGNAIGGMDDPRLSMQQNEQARRQAILQSGLATLAASQQSGATGLGSIAQGAMHGLQAGAQGRELAYQRGQEQQTAEVGARARAQMADIFAKGGDPLPRLQDAFMVATQSGDTESAKAIGTVIQSLAAQQSRASMGPVRGSPEWLAAREAELKLEAQYRQPGAPVPGTPEYTAMLEERARIAAKYRPAARTAAGSEDERKAASFLAFIPNNIAYVDQFLGTPGRMEQALTDKGLREGTSEEMQKLNLSAIAIGEAWLRMTTGAGYNRDEMQNAGYMFVPRPGDKAGTLEMKRGMRTTLMEMLRMRAGRALGGVAGAAPSEGPPAYDLDDPFGDL